MAGRSQAVEERVMSKSNRPVRSLIAAAMPALLAAVTLMGAGAPVAPAQDWSGDSAFEVLTRGPVHESFAEPVI